MSNSRDEFVRKIDELEKLQCLPHPAYLEKLLNLEIAKNELFESHDPDWFVGVMMRLASKYSINSQPLLAEQVLDISLGVIFQVEEKLGARLHKGSLFYFWSLFALESGQFDWSFILMHKALKEDQESAGDFIAIPMTPAAMFVTLDAKSSDQFALGTVRRNRKVLEDFLNKMKVNADYPESLSITSFLSAKGVDAWERSVQFVYSFIRYKHLVQSRRYGLCDTPFGCLYLQRLESDIVTQIENAVGDLAATHVEKKLSLQSVARLNSASNERLNSDGDSAATRSLIIGSMLYKDQTLDAGFAMAIVVRNNVNHRNDRMNLTVDDHLHLLARLLYSLVFALNKASGDVPV